MSRQPALQKIEVTEENKNYRVEWNYHGGLGIRVLYRRDRDPSICIDSILVATGISQKLKNCLALVKSLIKTPHSIWQEFRMTYYIS